MSLALRILLTNQLLALLLCLAFGLAAGPRHLPAIARTTFVLTNAVGGCVGLLFLGLERWGIYQGSPRSMRHLLRVGTALLGTGLGLALGVAVLRLLVPGLHIEARGMAQLGAFALAMTLVMTLLHMGYVHLRSRLEQKAIEVQKLRELEARTRLRSLQAKVNPHVLFNTLNAMLNLVHRDPDAVETLILRLSDLYRRLLMLPEQGLIRLDEEVDLIRDYLEIERLRLGERLSFRLEIEPEAAGVELPPLLIEPLVENAIKHGLAPKPGPGQLCVQARVEGDRLRVVVEDDGLGPGSGTRGCGFGLEGIQERLRLHHGDRARLVTGARKGGGFRAELEVPR